MKSTEIIKMIEREKAEELQIIAALEARNARLATMTVKEKELVALLHMHAAKDWDFLGIIN